VRLLAAHSRLLTARSRTTTQAAVSDSQADSHVRNSSVILEQVIAELDLLNHNTEQDFLRIGGKLGEFIETVNVISSRLAALVNMISGAHGLSTSQALESALDCFTEIRTRYKHRSEGLGGMRRDVARLRQTLGGFQPIVSNFHAIGVLTRVEIARLGSAGADFGNLADDMSSLTGHVRTKVEIALQTGALLIPPIESVIGNIAALEEKQVRDLSGAFANLSAFRDIQSRARDSSARLGARYEAISAAFRKLIVSIQFHDMTRQQVEHVIAIRRRLCLAGEAEGAGDSGLRGVAAAVLALQSSQLADAAEKFAASAASVAQNLEDIAAHIAEMADKSRTLSGVSKDEGNTYFLQMERGCMDILLHLKQLAGADSVTRVTSGDLEETIGQMRRSMEEIGQIEIQMLRMALNGTIVATHIGTSGDALSVLTGSMQERALESRQRSESLVEALGTMSEAANVLFGEGGPAVTERRASQDACVIGMLSAVAELHTSGERSIARIAEIIGRGAGLREDLSATRDSFSVGELFSESIMRVREMLSRLEDESRSDAVDEAPKQGLEDFATHYTMQSERDVHERVTGLAVGPPPVAPQSEDAVFTSEEDGEFGDNVELF
jgi:hypothetical protein